MSSPKKILSLLAVVAILSGLLVGQQTAQSAAVVPRMVNYSGKATDAKGAAVPGVAGVTFAIYKDQYDGAPLWMETQSVNADAKGIFSAQLGATRTEGLPTELFSSGEARWLGVRINGGEEQPRVMLLSVPYALKAGDAATLGGMPLSAFVLAAPMAVTGPGGNPGASASPSAVPPATSSVTTTGGTVNTLPLFTTGTDIQSSTLTQTGTGATAKIGIGTAAPLATLDVKGSETVRGVLNLPATGPAAATAGKNSQPLTFTASSYNTVVGAPANQNFRWQAEPAGNNTAKASGTLNLLYGAGANALAETGLHVASNGQVTFAAGQVFPGTVTSVSSGSGLTGGPITGTGVLSIATGGVTNAMLAHPSVTVTAGTDLLGGGPVALGDTTTLNLDTTKVPQLGTANTFTGAQSVIGAITATGTITGNYVSGVYGSFGGPRTTGLFGFADLTSGWQEGVFGEDYYSTTGAGVLGNISGSLSSTTVNWTHNGGGVWGDGGTSYYGVIGTSDNLAAGYFVNATDRAFTLYAQNSSPDGGPFGAYNSSGHGCNIDGSGDLTCTGTVSNVAAIENGARKVALAAIESPKNWFEDFGSEQLASGSAVVSLEADFAQTVNTELEYHVFLTPRGDCKGLYVTNQTPESFEVRELGGGTSSVKFDYRIVALRKNFESIRMADHTHDLDKQPKSLAEAALSPDRNKTVPAPNRDVSTSVLQH